MTERAPLSHDDLVALVGDLDDALIAAILAMGPTAEEIEEALACAADEDDVMAELERPLSGNAAKIYEILTADQDEDERR